MEDICDAVHRHGAKIFVQLHHGGREAPPALNGGRQAMAPSVELNSVIGRDTILPREMTVEDIDRLVGLFVQAAVNSELAGATRRDPRRARLPAPAVHEPLHQQAHG